MTNTAPYFSVIIPTKNEEKLIEACIKSLLNQTTQKKFEIIVIDNESQDGTLEIIKKYPVRILLEKKRGKSLAVQIGATHARGKILCFTEADCEVNENWLDSIDKAFSSSSNIVGATGLYSFYPTTSLYGTLATIFLPLASYLYFIVYRNHAFRGTNFAILRSIYQKIGGFDTSMKEMHDVELGLRARKFGKILLIPQMKIKTSDRRINKRFFAYLGELIPSLFHLLILGKSVPEELYKDIR